MRTNRSKRLILGTAAATLLFAGSAFTASNTLEGPNVAGYGTATVTGATVSSIAHTLSADGTAIESTALVFTTTQAARTVRAGFDGTMVDCTVDTEEPTKASCTFTGVVTADASSFAVAVS